MDASPNVLASQFTSPTPSHRDGLIEGDCDLRLTDTDPLTCQRGVFPSPSGHSSTGSDRGLSTGNRKPARYSSEPGLVPENLRELVKGAVDIPPELYVAHFPTPRDCLDLRSLGLRARTFHVLEKHGYAADPQKLGQLTLGQALWFRAFGITSANDLAESLYRFNRADPDRAVLPRNLRAIVAKEGKIARSLLHCRLPTPRGVQRLATLGLKTGTFGALVAAGYADNVSALSVLTASQLLEISGLGLSGLTDLVEALYRSAGRNRRQLTARQARALRTSGVRCSPDVLAAVLPDLPPGTSLSDLALTRRAFSALENAGYSEETERLNGLTVRELFRIRRLARKGVADLFEAIHRIRKRKPSHPKSMTLDELVIRRLAPRGDRRTRSILAQYFGLAGQSRATLRAVGRTTGLSGERIRQVCWTRSDELVTLRDAPVVRAIRLAVRRVLPCRPSVIEQELVANGLLHQNTTFRTLLRILAEMGCDPDWATLGGRGEEVVVAKDQLALAKKVRAVVRSEAERHGCCRWRSTIASICAATDASRKFVEAVVAAHRDFRWLDGAPDWFWMQTARPTGLRRRIARTLTASRTITFKELHADLHKVRRLKSVPPLPVLRKFCDQVPECRVIGKDRICSIHELDCPIFEDGER